MKYSEIISLQDYFHPVFNLQNEATGYWKQFIPTSQFNNLLEKTLDAVSSSVSANRKSIWVQGTFGTGKSHAGSVIKHLLCDDKNDIAEYVTNRIEKTDINSRLTELRKNKRFFSVVLSGVEGAYNPRTFALSLERTIKETLRKEGHNIKVESDFERAIDLIENNQALDLSAIINNEPELRVIAKTKEDILKKLRNADIETFLALEEALAKYSVHLSAGDITKWLSEIEAAIVSNQIADGLIIFWDEFTSVMDTISSGLINTLQNIAELTEKQNIYLYLISHRVPIAQGERGKDITKMNDRFHIIQYKMEAITTYHIMAATIQILDEMKYSICRELRMDHFSELISYLTDNDSQQSKTDIQSLFPLHPYTAFLCSSLADHIGSANRSVFNFMYDNKNGFLHFLNDENSCNDKKLLTADCLWDFFLETFSNDSTKYGIVTETYYAHIKNVSAQGVQYEKVFKGILLLNAMKNTFEKEQVLPSDVNIKKLFGGESFENSLDDILNYFDKNQIVQKDPSDNFLIAFSSLPANEINEEKRKAESNFSDVIRILEFDPSHKINISKWFKDSLIRECELVFLPCSSEEHILRSRLSKGFKEPYSLHIALFLAMNEIERQSISDIVKKFAIEEFKDVIFIAFTEVMDADLLQRQRFIDYVATQQVAKRHNSNEQAQTHQKNANLVVTNWINRLKQGTFKLYFRDERANYSTSFAPQHINQNIGHKIFSCGVETMQIMRTRPMTFFKQQNSTKSAEVMLCALNREDAEKRFSIGQYTPAKYLLKSDEDEYVVENNMELKADAPDNHPLVILQRKVDELLVKARKQHSATFNLGTILQPLTESPFGLYSNIPNVAILAFTLRKYQNELYNAEVGVPITADNLRDKVIDIFNYWQGGRNESKLKVRFGSKEEKDLKETLITIFDLQNVPEVPDLTSIKNVRWGIAYYCKNKSKFPLWSLKYLNESNESISQLIDQIVDLVHKEETQPDQIKKVLKSIQEYSFELQKLLVNKSAFNEGFKNYIGKIESVTIEIDWWYELTEYLSQRMPNEIGWWKESDVESKVKDYFIQKTRPITSSIIPQFPESSDEFKIDSLVKEQNSKLLNPEKANSVKIKLTQANMPTPALKWILVQVLENFPETADIIDANL